MGCIAQDRCDPRMLKSLCRRCRISTWSRVESGVLGSKEFRVFISQSGTILSPWHDVPLYVDRPDLLLNFVNEIPKGTRPKMEIARDEPSNPIKQDVAKNQELRYLKAGDMPFNYGALPQTWEDPDWVHPDTKLGGDSDPLDAIEISDSPLAIGEITPVRVIGILGLIDEDETDWKVIVKRTTEPNSADNPLAISSADLGKITTWFRTYKLAEGALEENKLIFDGEMRNADYAREIIDEAHARWKSLRCTTKSDDRTL
uniref:inorganic diphosphatase n=1 Tax=Spongospora subterranea TaxID=70186 RepID=A0A0H5R8C0_9EUKA|eukprot:CRZ10071.1 hypothetical protein [Spongospora subterranea]